MGLIKWIACVIASIAIISVVVLGGAFFAALGAVVAAVALGALLVGFVAACIRGAVSRD